MDKQGPRVYSTGNYIRYLVITYNGNVKVSVKVKVAQLCPTLCYPHGLSMGFSRPEYWSG